MREGVFQALGGAPSAGGEAGGGALIWLVSPKSRQVG